MKPSARIHIITGHYGSGKTEFAVNYVLKRAETQKNLVIADMDIVNPYFRSREKQSMLESKGIRVVSSGSGYSTADVPALSPEIYGILQDEKWEVVLDVGGDPVGARVLGRYHEYFKRGDYHMWMVVNANRPNTQTAEEVIQYLRDIERASRVTITGLINNTHMLRDTQIEDILRGNQLVEEVADKTGLPIVFTSLIKELAHKLPRTIKGEILPMELNMRPEWL